MDKYENLGLVGEGSYGMVLKCKHKDTGQIVAIKKYLENEDDKTVKKIAMREIKMLKLLRHDHLVNLIEVFRRKRRLYLVFEFMDHTVLDELEKYPHGLDELSVRKMLWQVLKGIEFCHVHNVIHRDIKPENILVNKSGIVKVCDFGFARTLGLNSGEMYTDYVATRWYRAPELLVGETKYGKAVDTWAVGCLLGEMLCGDPLFPGESDIDQLYHVIKCFGNLIPHHREIFSSNPLFRGLHLPEMKDQLTLQKKCPKISLESLDLMKLCLSLDPSERPSSTLLLRHTFFHKDGFFQRFPQEIRLKLQRLNQKHSSGLKKQKSNESIKSDEKESKKKKREKEKLKESEQKSKKKHNEHEKVGNSMLPSMATNGLFQEPAPNCQMTGDFTTEKSDHSPPKYYCGMTLPNVLLPYKKSDIGFKKDQIVDNSKKQMLGPLHTFDLSPHHKTVVSDKKKGKEPSRKDNLCLPKVDQTEGSKSKERNFEKSNMTSVPHMPTFEPFPCNLIFALFNRREMRGV